MRFRWTAFARTVAVAFVLAVAGYGCGGEAEEEEGREITAVQGGGSSQSTQGSSTQGSSSQGGAPAQDTCECPTGFTECACPTDESSQGGPQGGPQSGQQGANAQAANAGGPQADDDVCCCCETQP